MVFLFSYLNNLIGVRIYTATLIAAKGIGYEWLRGLAVNFAITRQTENLRKFSEVGENQQLLVANVRHRFNRHNFFHFCFGVINSIYR